MNNNNTSMSPEQGPVATFSPNGQAETDKPAYTNGLCIAINDQAAKDVAAAAIAIRNRLANLEFHPILVYGDHLGVCQIRLGFDPVAETNMAVGLGLLAISDWREQGLTVQPDIRTETPGTEPEPRGNGAVYDGRTWQYNTTEAGRLAIDQIWAAARDDPAAIPDKARRIKEAYERPPVEEPVAPQANGQPPTGFMARLAAVQPTFTCTLMSEAEFCAPVEQAPWLVNGVLMTGEPTVVGGPMKALKTGILTDLVVSLGTGTKFLNRFTVPNPVRVAMLSGETKQRVLQQNALEMARTRGVSLGAGEYTFWGFELPQIDNPVHLDGLRQLILSKGLEVLVIDPLYLTISDRVDHSNMFHMGPILTKFGDMCLAAGCLPILCHHFPKSRAGNPYDPPELNELAYAGIGQWMRQWILVARRESYDASSGMHKLHWRHGGSFGHSGELAINIHTGVVNEQYTGRQWQVTVETTGQRIEAEKESQAAKQLEKDVQKANEKAAKELRQFKEDMIKIRYVLATSFFGEPWTKTRLSEMTHINYKRTSAAVTHLQAAGEIRPVDATVKVANGAKKSCIAYELIK